MHHLAHLTVLQITNVTESIPSYLLAVIMVLAVVLIFLLCWRRFLPLSRFFFFILPAICTRDAHTAGAARRTYLCVALAQDQTIALAASRWHKHNRQYSPLSLSCPCRVQGGCFYCMCLVGAERRAFHAAKKRKRGERLA